MAGFGSFAGGVAQGFANVYSMEKLKELQMQKEAKIYMDRLQQQQNFQKEQATVENTRMFERMQKQQDYAMDQMREQAKITTARDTNQLTNQMILKQSEAELKALIPKYTPDIMFKNFNVDLQTAEEASKLANGGMSDKANALIKERGFQRTITANAEAKEAADKIRARFEERKIKILEKQADISEKREQRMAEQEFKQQESKIKETTKADFKTLLARREELSDQYRDALSAGDKWLKAKGDKSILFPNDYTKIMSILEQGGSINTSWYSKDKSQAMALVLERLKEIKNERELYHWGLVNHPNLTEDQLLQLYIPDSKNMIWFPAGIRKDYIGANGMHVNNLPTVPLSYSVPRSINSPIPGLSQEDYDVMDNADKGK